MDLKASPPLRLSEIDDRVRLGLDGFGYVEGATLQEAADRLVGRLLEIAIALRATAVGPFHPECCPDPAHLEFIWKLDDLAAAGGDPRTLVFGPNPVTPA